MSEPDGYLGAELRASVQRIYSRFRSERGEGELGDAAVIALSTLQKYGPITLTALSEHARVTPGSMSQTVNRLVDGGYVVREKDPDDRRRVLIGATADGLRAADAARSHRRDWLDARLAELTDDERAVLRQAAALMRRVADG